MVENYVARKDVELVENARGEKNAFTRVAVGIGGELPLREFEQRMPFVLQI